MIKDRGGLDVSVFFGICIRMRHDEHLPPHFHAEYQGFEAMVLIESGTVWKGALPSRAERLVREWALLHQVELMRNWEHGLAFEPMERIAGADND
jgi:hypothetical protein